MILICSRRDAFRPKIDIVTGLFGVFISKCNILLVVLCSGCKTSLLQRHICNSDGMLSDKLFLLTRFHALALFGITATPTKLVVMDG